MCDVSYSFSISYIERECKTLAKAGIIFPFKKIEIYYLSNIIN